MNFLTEQETRNPANDLQEREFEETVLKMGSFLSIIQNKKINQAKLIITIIQNKIFGNCFLEISNVENAQSLIFNILKKYPTLYKSKIIYKTLVNKNANNRKRNI